MQITLGPFHITRMRIWAKTKPCRVKSNTSQREAVPDLKACDALPFNTMATSELIGSSSIGVAEVLEVGVQAPSGLGGMSSNATIAS